MGRSYWCFTGENLNGTLEELLPVDPPRTLIRFDVHFVVVNIHFWDLHLKVVGKQLDGLADGAHARPAGSLEHLLQGWGVRPHGHCGQGTERERE